MDREDVDRDLLDSLQKMIFVDGLFTLAFRRLVGLGSGSHSQRRELQIEVLKAKCHTLEVLSRGGTKTVNSEDVVRFESELVAFVGDMI